MPNMSQTEIASFAARWLGYVWVRAHHIYPIDPPNDKYIRLPKYMGCGFLLSGAEQSPVASHGWGDAACPPGGPWAQRRAFLGALGGRGGRSRRIKRLPWCWAGWSPTPWRLT